MDLFKNLDTRSPIFRAAHDDFYLSNSMRGQFVIMFLAVIRVRATAAPLNAAYTSEEFEFYLSDSESKLLITSPEGNKAAETAASKINLPHVTASLTSPDSELTLSLTHPE